AISLWGQRVATHDIKARRKVLRLTHMVDGPDDRLGLGDLLAAQWRAWVSPSPEDIPSYRIIREAQAA
ncbi:MAG TPA: hypothetical protein VEA79_15455, partial [Phenylobacterium sp.]|nr:hypothetical protein [Phenylobacterium sp.]